MLQIDKTSKIPYYVQIYEYVRREIEAQRLHAGDKLMSVRDLAQSVNVSKMTVEKACFQLASEGYIVRRNKARYEVASLGDCPSASEPGLPAHYQDIPPRPRFTYDFGSGDMDMEHFPMDNWRKCMNRVLSDPERLLACMDEQGVAELRRALSQYVYQSRGVHAVPEAIVIGSGTPVLLRILISLLGEDFQAVGVENPGFRLGRELFRHSGYAIYPVPMQQGQLELTRLYESGVRLMYVSPSHQFPTGTVMSAGMRNRLLQWAYDQQGMIIEDDYDSELRYYGRPVPALQGLDRSGRVIYMGSLSKVLPPFVRLSYMVLPPDLLERYDRQRDLFRQGTSVPEQCVLAEYINSGEMTRQVRRLRKEYQDKGAYLMKLLQSTFGRTVDVNRVISGVYCRISLHSPYTAEELMRRAERAGCRILSMDSFYETADRGKYKEFLLSFSKIPSCQLAQAVQTLHRAWTGKEGI